MTVDIFVFLGDYIDFFPLLAFVCLMLAGLNVPISEDLVIITAAFLTYKDPSMMPYNLGAIYAGVILSDMFMYWVGGKVRKGVSKSRFFTKLIPEKGLEKMRYYLDKYGIFTFIVCRFIPFGVRNTLFFTSGLFGLKFKVFALYDIIAAMISINTLFFLFYNFGDSVKRPFKIAGHALFFILVSGLLILIIRAIVKLRKKRRDKITECKEIPENDERS